ncbi:MAG: HAD family hydrolase [Pseudomonadota bacterium]
MAARTMADRVLRLAMWSGPRNISTAMMRAWGSRSDTVVWDEPLYAHYLAETGLDHPGAHDVIEAGLVAWPEVRTRLLGPLPDGKSIFFQKHMTHHLIDSVDRDWLDAVVSCFLIRDPRRVLASYLKTRPHAELADIGVAQQTELLDELKRRHRTPVILDSGDILRNPEAMLRGLCDFLDVDFSPDMLNWTPGLQPTDGVWAKHWYSNVLSSSGFQPYRERNVDIPGEYRQLVDEAMAHFERLYEERLH